MMAMPVQVHCKICKRHPDAHLSLRARIRTGNFYTHHQRSVILDALGGSARVNAHQGVPMQD